MQYKEFQEKNDSLKGSNVSKLRITDEIVTSDQEKVTLSNGTTTIIKDLVTAIYNGKGYITNPSKLANWGSFKESKPNDNKVYLTKELLESIKDLRCGLYFKSNQDLEQLENKCKSSKISYKKQDGFLIMSVDYKVYIVSNKQIALPQDCRSLFEKMLVTSIDFTNVDTSQVTAMNCMFYGCNSLETLDLSNFDTSQVINMAGMFANCKSLQTLDLSNFDTSQVTLMVGMFENCKLLQILDLSSFDTSYVTNMKGMFKGCKSLQTLDLSNFDTSNVVDMYFMFIGCQSLQTIDLSSFDTSQVTDMHCMFDSCESLETLDLSNFDTSQVINMYGMFANCKSLQTIDLSSFDTSHVEVKHSMFAGCETLQTIVYDVLNNTDLELQYAKRVQRPKVSVSVDNLMII